MTVIKKNTDFVALQDRQSFFAPAIAPGQDSGMVLAADSDPFYFSLSTRSTVPYVTIGDSSNTNKRITWGELTCVMPGQKVTVKNSSYHLGDIEISTGRDYTTIPTRVTVPVRMRSSQVGETDVRMETMWPCDCRRAKRAYFTIIAVFGANVLITFRNQWLESSFKTNINSTDDSGPAFNYVDYSVILPAATNVGQIPMGIEAQMLAPMTLGDAVSASFTYNTVDTLINQYLAFYTLEY